MKDFQRQLFVLLTFMLMLTAVTLFLFVYAPDPAQPPALHISAPLPEPLQNIINQSVTGYEAMFRDLGNASWMFNSTG